MLYDLLPPLLFFASLGGIIFIISRVVARIRHHQLTESIEAVTHTDKKHSTKQLKPTQATINLFKSPTVLWSRAFAELKAGLIVVGGWSARAGVVVWRRAKQLKLPTVKLPRRERIVLQQAEEIAPQEAPAPKPHIKTRIAPQAVMNHQVVSPKFFKKKEAPAKPLTELDAAQAAVEEGNLERAEDILVPYIYKHTKDVPAYMLLGQVALARREWSEAMEIFEQVVKRSPKEEGAYANLGHAAYNAGRYSKALQALQRAHEANPTDVSILQELFKIASNMDNAALQHSIKEKLVALDRVR